MISESYTSDAILNAPDIFFQYMAQVFRSWLIHGTVSLNLLACAFLPLLKSSLKNPDDTSSYRAIAGSSLLLKLFDKVVLLIWGHLLASDTLQFGYKEGTSTTQCSWLVLEVANHFIRDGTYPIMTLLDCSRAFDMCRFDILFTRLLERRIPAIVIRTLIRVYEDQYAWVRWGRARSSLFSIVNGTRQGSVLSPALFAVYIDGLLKELRDLGVGCHVGDVFMGAVGFCDDILLLAPNRSAMAKMLTVCEKFAKDNNLQFSTDPDPAKSKSKCIYMVGAKKTLKNPAPLQLNGKDLPWVKSANHLGHELSQDGTMDSDIRMKRAIFIQRSTEVRETFDFAHPVEILRAIKVYCCDFYGSMLMDMQGPVAAQLYNSWKTAVKLAWDVPRETRTYFVDHLLSGGVVSARIDILARFSNFYKKLRLSSSNEVQILVGIVSRDIRTTTARNLSFIREESGLDARDTSSKIRESLIERRMGVPDEDSWRIGYLSKLLEERQQLSYHGQDMTRVTELIDALCIN